MTLHSPRVYVFEDSRRPLMIAHMSGRVSADELVRFKADIDALVDRLEPHALVYDLAEVEIPPREVVMDMLRWTRTLRRRFSIAYEQRPDPIPTFTAYYMPARVGAVLRFFEQMIPAIRNQQGYFASLDQAIVASEQALHRFGVEVPPPQALTVETPRSA